MLNSNFTIPQLYDSHVHWQATGQVALGLQLQSFQNREQFAALKVSENYLRGEWLTGFGWDENTFAKDVQLDRNFLDQFFPDRPVLLSRIDGHSSWLNSLALRKLGWTDAEGVLTKSELQSFLEVDSTGRLTGLAHEKAHMEALLSLPETSPSQLREQLLAAQEIFLASGITHIRDMTSHIQIWDIA